MTTDYHTPLVDGVTKFCADDLNAPLGELDEQIGTNADAIATNASAISGKADASHAHVEADITDLDKYTQSEVDALLAAGVPPESHTHVEADITDLDKYTQSEVDAALAGKSDTTHNHNLADLAEKSYDSLTDTPTQYYVLCGFCPGTVGDGETILRHTFPMAVDFPSGLTGSQSKAGTAATAETVFSIKKNGTEVGTITYAASGTTGTLAMASATSFAVGDTLTIVGPATADATLADMDVALKGDR